MICYRAETVFFILILAFACTAPSMAWSQAGTITKGRRISDALGCRRAEQVSSALVNQTSTCSEMASVFLLRSPTILKRPVSSCLEIYDVRDIALDAIDSQPILDIRVRHPSGYDENGHPSELGHKEIDKEHPGSPSTNLMKRCPNHVGKGEHVTPPDDLVTEIVILRPAHSHLLQSSQTIA
jgi:hypothetical protein